MTEFALKIKGYYEADLWSLARVDKALELGRITQEEYDIIVKGE